MIPSLRTPQISGSVAGHAGTLKALPAEGFFVFERFSLFSRRITEPECRRQLLFRAMAPVQAP
ncbi:MAG: hypothetical protein CMF59_19010 [Leptospiraceae bacterium]|nr:hypothetical protein [Leptospiraceae bacterium]